MKVAAISDKSQTPIEKPHDLVRVDVTLSRMGKDVTFTADLNAQEAEEFGNWLHQNCTWLKREEIATR